jgi:hypothetical protein
MPTFAGLIAAVLTFIAIFMGVLLLFEVFFFGPKHSIPPSLVWTPVFLPGVALGGAVAAFYAVRAWARRWRLRQTNLQRRLRDPET